MRTGDKRPLMISNGWIQAAVIVVLIGFCIMGVLTYYTYSDEPPIPQNVKTIDGAVLFTHDDIVAGQRIFLENGLMEYGSVTGVLNISTSAVFGRFCLRLDCSSGP